MAETKSAAKKPAKKAVAKKAAAKKPAKESAAKKAAAKKHVRKIAAKKASGLSHQEIVAVSEYCVHLNWARACRAAGYKSRNSEYQVWQRPRVREAIKKAIAEKVQRNQMDADALVNKLCHMAFANVADVVTIETDYPDEEEIERGLLPEQRVRIMDTEFWPGSVKDAISSIKNTKDGIAIECQGREKALDILSKHFGLLKEETTVVDNRVIILPAEVKSEEAWQEAAVQAGEQSRKQVESLLKSKSKS